MLEVSTARLLTTLQPESHVGHDFAAHVGCDGGQDLSDVLLQVIQRPWLDLVDLRNPQRYKYRGFRSGDLAGHRNSVFCEMSLETCP